MAKTETIVLVGEDLQLHVTCDEFTPTSVEALEAQDAQVARDILYVENEIASAQARRTALLARKTQTAALVADARVKKPKKAEK